MATTPTTKKTAAKKTAAKKTAAKKTVAKQTVAKQTVAKKAPANKVAAKRSVAKPAASLTDTVTATVANTVANVADTTSEQAQNAADFAVGVFHTSIGLPFVLSARLPEFEMPNVELPKFELPEFPKVDLTSFDLAPVKALLIEAKGEGSARIAALQAVVVPVATEYAKRIEVRVESLFDQIEAPLPQPVRGYMATSRKRVRDLVAA